MDLEIILNEPDQLLIIDDESTPKKKYYGKVVGTYDPKTGDIKITSLIGVYTVNDKSSTIVRQNPGNYTFTPDSNNSYVYKNGDNIKAVVSKSCGCWPELCKALSDHKPLIKKPI